MDDGRSTTLSGQSSIESEKVKAVALMKDFLRKTGRSRSGQSAIEFTIVVVVVLFFLLFFLSLSILLVVSEYVEYATFMSARTYKSMFSSKDVQQQNARLVFQSYMDKVQGIARNPQLTFVEGDNPQSAGVVAQYNIDLFYLPPVFMPFGVPPSRITLKTETRLGRDPAFQDCSNYFDAFAQRMGLNIQGTNFLTQMDDNGC
jgi:hypothetical protein